MIAHCHRCGKEIDTGHDQFSSCGFCGHVWCQDHARQAFSDTQWGGDEPHCLSCEHDDGVIARINGGTRPLITPAVAERCLTQLERDIQHYGRESFGY